MDWRLIGLVALLLVGCANGRQVSGDQAAAYFEVRESSYRRIVSLVDQCRPVRSGSNGGYNRVWADGSRGEGLHCLNAAQDVELIRSALREIEAVSVFYMTEDGPMAAAPSGPLVWVKIGVHSSGIVTSGRSVDFVYSPQSLEAAPADEGDASYRIERRLVGSAPYHWYWESSSN